MIGAPERVAEALDLQLESGDLIRAHYHEVSYIYLAELAHLERGLL